jgi:hypothetical protein
MPAGPLSSRPFLKFKLRDGQPMNGVIEFRNHQMGRYALHTEADRYTVFQVLRQGDSMDVGETVSGELEYPSTQVYQTGHHGKVSVFVEKTHCARGEAAAWVSGSLAAPPH